MGRRRAGILLILIVLLVLLAIWWSAPGAGPPGGPQAPVDTEDAGEARRPGVPMSSEGHGDTRETDEITLLAMREPPRRSGPPDLGPELGGGLGPGLGLSEAKPKIWMTGRLVDADGKPLAGVNVHLEPEFETKVVEKRELRTGTMQRVLEVSTRHGYGVISRCGRAMSSYALVASTGADGHFEIPAPGGRGLYRVVFATGRGSREILIRTGRYRFSTSARANLGTVIRPTGGSLVGQVTDTAGRPVAGARVSYWPEAWGVTLESLLPAGEAPVDRTSFRTAKLMSGGSGLGAVDTDDDGRFEIRGVLPGTHTVLARGPSARTQAVTIEGIVVHDGAKVPGLLIVIDELVPPLISGRVLDEETGKPVRAFVRIWREVTGQGWPCRIRADGRFVADRLEPGRYGFTVSAPGYERKVFDPRELATGQRLEGLELRLEPTEK